MNASPAKHAISPLVAPRRARGCGVPGRALCLIVRHRQDPGCTTPRPAPYNLRCQRRAPRLERMRTRYALGTVGAEPLQKRSCYEAVKAFHRSKDSSLTFSRTERDREAQQIAARAICAAIQCDRRQLPRRWIRGSSSSVCVGVLTDTPDPPSCCSSESIQGLRSDDYVSPRAAAV